MTKLFNDPALFMDEMLEGFFDIYPHYVMPVPGGMIRSTESDANKVAVVVGGGSGHYPAFYGVVGHGFADGAVVGNIFTSPSTQDVYNVCKAAHRSGGVLLITGNYAGDVLNFKQAQEKLNAEGIRTEYLWTTDDVASAVLEEKQKRRGIAGSFAVFKVAGAAAEEGRSLAEVYKVATKANDSIRTYGVGFSGCTLPGAKTPLFSVPEGKMELGLGIHGEPGISEDAIPTAHELAETLVAGVLEELSEMPIKRVAVILNGLGATKYEELFVLWKSVSTLISNRGYTIVQPEVGEIVTSLDMAGCSLSIMLLDPELERLWCAPADTPAYRNASNRIQTRQRDELASEDRDISIASPLSASDFSHQSAQWTAGVISGICQMLEEVAEELGRIDAVAGDGDHGRGMLKGAKAAQDAAFSLVSRGGGLGSLFTEVGEAWAAKAGGTSGVLWGAGLGSIAKKIGDDATSLTSKEIVEAVNGFISTIAQLGKAELGDKTMLDAMIPFAKTLGAEVEKGSPIKIAWEMACVQGKLSAKETSHLSPKIGRARPLAERSLGNPDAGAISFAMIAKKISEYI
ncbi:MAG: dihydroxyacetone kinase family protein [Candidatus Nanopelagicaceae bacterium]